MILGEGFQLTFTDFSEFKSAVQVFMDRQSSLDRWNIFNKSYQIKDKSKIVVDSYNRLYLNLSSNEEIRVVIYINYQKFPEHFFSPANIFPENLNRYHIYKCPSVEKLLHQNDKHIVATAKKDGGFHYKFLSSTNKLMFETNNQHLYICRYCLAEFNKKYNSDLSPENFNINFYLEN